MPLRSLCVIVALTSLLAQASQIDARTFDLTATIPSGELSQVEYTLEIGGQLLVQDEQGRSQKLPLRADAQLRFDDCCLAWSALPSEPARALRRYQEARVEFQGEPTPAQRALSPAKRVIVAQVGSGKLLANSLGQQLTQEEAALVSTVADPLALDRLLPGREVASGEQWNPTPEALAGLLGLERVVDTTAQCVVTGESQGQVQIGLEGTVRGEVDGATTEMELEGAYLFHLARQRITKFNLAIKEQRTAGVATPGLDVTVRATVAIGPAGDAAFAEDDQQRALAMSELDLRHVLVEDAAQGYRFLSDTGWLVTGRQRTLLSLRLVQQGRLVAHCNVATLPARTTGPAPTLEKFERDVRSSLGDNVQKIAAAREWKTAVGHRVLGIFADGAVEETPMQWRYYLIEEEGLPLVTISITVEQSKIPDFADADRLIVDSVELFRPTGSPVASSEGAGAARR